MTEKVVPLDDGESTTQPQAWLIRPDGTGARMIYEGAVNGIASPLRFNMDAVWSHDGSVVHVTRYPGLCVPHFYDVPATGGAAVPRGEVTNRDWQFTWSPDDTKIAYYHFTSEDQICEHMGSEVMTHSIIVMNSDSSGQRVVEDNAFYRVTDWWPDGSALVAINDDTQRWYKVGVTDGSTSYLGVAASSLKVSPDGSRFAYVNSGILHVRNVDGSSDRNLGAAADYAWNPTGTSLAIGGARLSLVNPATGVGKVVYSGAAAEPTWAPDGTRIAFLHALPLGECEIKVVIPKVGTVLTIPGVTNAQSVEWEP